MIIDRLSVEPVVLRYTLSVLDPALGVTRRGGVARPLT